MKNNAEAASDLVEDTARWAQNIANAAQEYREDLAELHTLETDLESLLE